ncbi:MAG TPA: hypothetical protein VNI60_12455 [Pyrinomonadaceae bacterium]|nr:hypothetical protein [Pyrinomonadaceae bacterium]
MKKHIVCIASFFKGNDFFEECREAGWRITLVTRKSLLDEPWAWTSLSEVKTVQNDAVTEDYIRVAANIAGRLRKDYAGITLCLANEEQPDTFGNTDAEIVYRISKPKHVGLIFHSQKHKRIEELLGIYTEKISRDLLAVAPTKERYDD